MNCKILVTGSDGYIGSILCKKLQGKAEVTGLDTGYYRSNYLYIPTWNFSETISKDIREITIDDLRVFDTVICLSDLNDPLSQVYPELTERTNFEGPAQFATLCKKAGIKKFIYSSSASVYGYASDELMDENSNINPLTQYAMCKSKMEKHLMKLNEDKFSVACLRNSTVYGLSPRMRFDLLINYLCATAITKNIIELKSDGKAWRPFVHIDDVCDTILSILDLPASDMSGLILNVGDGKNGNYRVIDVAKIIQDLTGCKIILDRSSMDKRSYKISSNKLEGLGIHCMKDLRSEITKILNFFKHIELSESDLSCRTYTRLNQIQYLLRTKQLDEELFWIQE